MVMYLDDRGKKIQKGFYRYHNSDNLIYFTGEYDEDTKLPIFEKGNELENTRIFPNHVVIKLHRVYKRDVRKNLDELIGRTNWLREKLKE